MMQLSPSQEAAAAHNRGPALVLAGPGSGKTAVITYRLQYLIHDAKILPEQILVVTFSRKAAAQMEERFRLLCPGLSETPFFSTFHSFFFRILKAAYHLNQSNILSDTKKRAILKELIETYCPDLLEDANHITQLLKGFRSYRKTQLLSGDAASFAPDLFMQLYEAYYKTLSEERLIDFEDMLGATYTLLHRHPEVCAFWHNRYPYILIDEFQDIDPLQYQILQLLAFPENNLFAVGDDDQSIYAFRGADPKLLRRFLTDYPDASRFFLTENYRCQPAVLDASLKVIRANRNRMEKEPVCKHTENGPGKVQLFSFANPQTQYRHIAEAIRLKALAGIPYSEIAVLLRTNRDVPLIKKILQEAGIPIRSAGPEHFSPDAYPSLLEDFLAYIRLSYMLCGRFPFQPEQARMDLYRILNKPSRYLSGDIFRRFYPPAALSLSEVLQALQQGYAQNPKRAAAIAQLSRHLSFLSGMTPYAALRYIRSGIGYDLYLEETDRRHGSYAYGQQNEDRELWLQALEGLWHGRKSFFAFSSLTDFSDAEQNPAFEDTSGVSILTMHAAKGLEFEVVFLPDLNEGILPSEKAQTADAKEEERRLLYVAMTRAISCLEISYTQTRYQKKTAPSHFLKELLET